MTAPTITDDGLWSGRMLHFASLPSTNSWVVANTELCGHGDVIIADDQTEGRGRFNRTWSSEAGRSLTLSFVVDPARLPLLHIENYAQITALAVWQMLGGLKIEAKLKWPNDILTERGKICGILAENVSATMVVVGLGINTSLEEAKVDPAKPFTSIHREIDAVPSQLELREALVRCLQTGFNYCNDSGLDQLWETWRAHDYLAGRTITVRSGTSELSGEYLGINHEGRLLIRDENETREFASGDVTLASTG